MSLDMGSIREEFKKDLSEALEKMKESDKPMTVVISDGGKIIDEYSPLENEINFDNGSSVKWSVAPDMFKPEKTKFKIQSKHKVNENVVFATSFQGKAQVFTSNAGTEDFKLEATLSISF